MRKILHGNSARLISSRQTIIRSSTSNSHVVEICSFFKNGSFETARNRELPSSPPIKRFMATKSSVEKCLTVDNINPNFVTMQYAVRGPMLARAIEVQNELEEGVKKPFSEVIRTNVGDAHALGQKPITYVRQILALLLDPSLCESDKYPDDVKQRARDLLNVCGGKSIGAYTDSAGIPFIRKQVAKFIEKRDCVPSDWNRIILTSGATPAIKTVLALLNYKKDGKPSGVMVPIPQYPLYTATMSEYGLQAIGYYLDESNNWGLDSCELQRSYDEAKDSCFPRALVVINPGNPTGQVLTRENVEDIIKFAQKNRLVILADEVYQDNIYDPNSKFYSIKRVMHEMGSPFCDMEVFSYISASKGYLGECGIRGGCMELTNICPQVIAMMMKTLSVSLCPATIGQATMSAYVNPPQPGEPSYEQFQSEVKCILDSLKERAELIYKTLNTFEGFKVNVIQGALYSFPQIEIPPKAIEAAKAKNMEADTFYTFELLETTGICIISGSGFGQQPGTYHFRSTILPTMEQLKVMMNKFREFHADFMNKYK